MGQELGCEFQREEDELENADLAKRAWNNHRLSSTPRVTPRPVDTMGSIEEDADEDKDNYAKPKMASRGLANPGADFSAAQPIIDEASKKQVPTPSSQPKKRSLNITAKLSDSVQQDGWNCSQKCLAQLLESPGVTGVVIILIFVDLVSTVINDVCENTNLINPAYDEQKEFVAKVTHTLCVSVLTIFFIEQILHLAAFGKAFFTRWWFVMDLVVVSISLTCETVLEGTADNWLALLVVLRLWKVVAFVFDVCLAENEDEERDEKLDTARVRKAAIYDHKGITGKLSASLEMPAGWQKTLGEFMESPHVSGVVIILIFVDLGGTFVNDMCENTDLINPKYDEQKELAAKATHTVCVSVLCIFFIEQILHLVAFGEAFFTKFWYVMDLVIVSISLICETVLEDKAEDWLALFIVLRLWKVVAFIFDLCLSDTEDAEMDENMYKSKATARKHTGMTGKLSAAPGKPEDPWRENIGEILESPHVTGVVIVLILVDLAGTFVNDMCENTDLINPKYDEQKEAAAKATHTICVTVLCIFLVEQLLHLVAFGAAFFTNFWFVMDLVIVSISLICETVLEDTANDWLALLVVLRLWKVVAFVFDTCLARNESRERDEKLYAREVEEDVYTKLPA